MPKTKKKEHRLIKIFKKYKESSGSERKAFLKLLKEYSQEDFKKSEESKTDCFFEPFEIKSLKSLLSVCPSGSIQLLIVDKVIRINKGTITNPSLIAELMSNIKDAIIHKEALHLLFPDDE